MKRLKTSVLMVLGVLMANSCANHKIEGLSVEDVFTEKPEQKLAAAACEGKTGLVDNLVKKGANVNAVGMDKITPLYWALTCRNIEGMEALLKLGADPNAQSKFLTPVMLAATDVEGKFIRILLKYGGDPNATKRHGLDTALYSAFSNGVHKESMKSYDSWEAYYALIENGADINLEDTGWSTIAEFAIGVYGRYSKAIELIDMGYNHNYAGLLAVAKLRIIPENSPEQKYKAELIAYLEARVTPEDHQKYLDSIEARKNRAKN